MLNNEKLHDSKLTEINQIEHNLENLEDFFGSTISRMEKLHDTFGQEGISRLKKVNDSIRLANADVEKIKAELNIETRLSAIEKKAKELFKKMKSAINDIVQKKSPSKESPKNTDKIKHKQELIRKKYEPAIQYFAKALYAYKNAQMDNKKGIHSGTPLSKWANENPEKSGLINHYLSKNAKKAKSENKSRLYGIFRKKIELDNEKSQTQLKNEVIDDMLKLVKSELSIETENEEKNIEEKIIQNIFSLTKNLHFCEENKEITDNFAKAIAEIINGSSNKGELIKQILRPYNKTATDYSYNNLTSKDEYAKIDKSEASFTQVENFIFTNKILENLPDKSDFFAMLPAKEYLLKHLCQSHFYSNSNQEDYLKKMSSESATSIETEFPFDDKNKIESIRKKIGNKNNEIEKTLAIKILELIANATNPKEVYSKIMGKKELFFSIDNLPNSKLENYFERNFETLMSLEDERFNEKLKALKETGNLCNFEPFLIDKIFAKENPTEYIHKLKNLLDELRTANFDIKNSAIISQLLPIPDEKRALCIDILKKIENSQIKEIREYKYQIFSQLIQTENPDDAYRKIIDIFEKNNLPLMGKIFKVFSIIYPTDELNFIINNSKSVSPFLKKAKPRSRLNTIYSDLLKIQVDSGNPDLENYLKFFQENSAVLEKFEKEGEENLEEKDVVKLNDMFKRIGTLFKSSQKAKTAKMEAPRDSSGLSQNYSWLKNELELKDGQTISTKIFEMFARPLQSAKTENISIENVLQRMRQAKTHAEQRNINLANNAKFGRLKLKKDDLLKGIDKDYIDSMLKNGLTAKEYLDSNAGSDSTPFDTDASLILPEESKNNLRKMVDDSLAKDYSNGLIIAIKDRGQFQKTNPETGKFDRTKFEIFKSILGDRHVGIRTGMPSTEIDFFIANDELTKKRDELEDIYLKIVKNGFYIPVTNLDGKIIFTPKMYEKKKALLEN